MYMNKYNNITLTIVQMYTQLVYHCYLHCCWSVNNGNIFVMSRVYSLRYLLSVLNERGFENTVYTCDPSPSPVGNLHACHCHGLR